MKLLSPTQHRRLNEIVGFLLLSLGLVMLLSLVSYHTQDPSFDTAASARPLNLVGYPGSYISDLLFQMFGAAALLFPFLIFLLSWKWIRSEELQAGGIKIFGAILLTLALSAALSFAPFRLFEGTIRIGYLRETPIMVMTKANGVSHDTVPYFMERFRDAYPNQLQNFAQNVLHDRPAPITIDDGMEALRIGVAATRARETGTTVSVAEVKS